MLTKIAETGTGVRCGNHGAQRVYHGTSADVRACFGSPALDRNWHDMRTPEERAVPSLLDLIAEVRGLLDSRQVNWRYRDQVSMYLDANPTAYGLQTAIQRLRPLELKKVGPDAAGTPAGQTFSVLAGRYAVEIDGALKFFRVDKPTEGRWKGYTFLKVQASDEFHPIRAKAARDAILCEIAKDPKEAMLRYGREIGACGHCGRTLTNDESRGRGIGPVCANKIGW